MLKCFLSLWIVIYSQYAFCQTPLPRLDKLATQKEKLDSLKSFSWAAVGSRDFTTALIGASKGTLLSEDNIIYQADFAYLKGYIFQELKQPDSAVANTTLAITLYEKSGYLEGAAEAMRRLHYIYYYAGRGPERVPMMKKAAAMIDTTTNSNAKSVLTAMLSEYYYDQGLYEKAIEFKLGYIAIQKNKTPPLDDKVMNDIAVTNSQIAETYLLIKEPAKAIE